MAKDKRPAWQKHSGLAAKKKAKILSGKCKNCGLTFAEGGISAYENICRNCASGTNVAKGLNTKIAKE